jgi:hypothetical protein
MAEIKHSFNLTERNRLEELAFELAKSSDCGMNGGRYNFSSKILAKGTVNLINRDYREFDRIFLMACDDLGASRGNSLPSGLDEFPPHRFILYEDGKLESGEIESLHYVMGKSCNRVEIY